MLESREMTELIDLPAKTPVDLLSWTCWNQGKWPSRYTGGQRFLWIYCPGHAGVKGHDRADRLAGKDSCESTVLDMLESRKMTEQTDWREKQPSQVACISEDLNDEELETLPAGTKRRTSHHWSPGGRRCRERQRSTIFLEKTRDGHCQSDQQRNYLTGNSWKISERRGGTTDLKITG